MPRSRTEDRSALRRYEPVWPIIYWGLFGIGFAYVLLTLLGLIESPIGPGGDTRAYWLAGHLDDPYRAAVVGGGNAFLYSPAFAQAWWPLAQIPFDVVEIAWPLLLIGCLLWLRAGWMLVLVPLMWDVLVGNIFILTGTAIVVGLRFPGAWAFPILTKVTPGIGLLWFAARREWRSLAIALDATAVIAATSVVVAPDLWAQWFGVLMSNAGASDRGIAVPLAVRLPLAIGLVVWGARTDRAWTVPIAAMLAMPVWWSASLAMLAALPRLVRPQ